MQGEGKICYNTHIKAREGSLDNKDKERTRTMPQITMITDMNPKSGKHIWVVNVPAYGSSYYFSSCENALEFSFRAIADIEARGLLAK